MKKIRKIAGVLALGAIFWTVVLWLFGAFTCNAGALAGKVEITSEKIIIERDPGEIKFFGTLPDHFSIPEGYLVAAEGTFKTNLVTVRCGYDYLVEKAEEICKKKKYSGYAFVSVKSPNMITESCYHADIIFLAKKTE